MNIDRLNQIAHETALIPYNRFETVLLACNETDFSPILGGNCISIGNYLRTKIEQLGIPTFSIQPPGSKYHVAVIAGKSKNLLLSPTDGLTEAVDITEVVDGDPEEIEIFGESIWINTRVIITLKDYGELSLCQKINQEFQDARVFDLSSIDPETIGLPIDYIFSPEYKLKIIICYQGKRIALSITDDFKFYITVKRVNHLEDSQEYQEYLKIICEQLQISQQELMKKLIIAKKIQVDRIKANKK